LFQIPIVNADKEQDLGYEELCEYMVVNVTMSIVKSRMERKKRNVRKNSRLNMV